MDKIKHNFLNPTSEYRGKPFWSWNGKLEKEELLRQIDVLKEMGFGGYFMHSRTGLETEYLGEEWFDLINACTDKGDKDEMESWIYDEDRWPSGTAGGAVTETKEYRMKFMRLNIVKAKDFTWSAEILAAYITDSIVDEVKIEDYERIYENTDKKYYENKIVLQLNYEYFGESTFYNGNTYVDTMNKEAINKYIEITHEKYTKSCGNRLGKSIKGVFTDEPHRGGLMSSFSGAEEKAEWAVPWTYTIFDNFKAQYGYDLRDRLPELYLIYKGNKVSPVKWQYVELLQQMFIDNFAKPIQKWCKRNNMLFTGHILHEDSFTTQTAVSGSMMRFYEYMDYPGVDVLTEFNDNYWIVKQLSSAARQNGQKWMLSELYGCTGWQFDFEKHKFVGDWQALFGINLRCPHLSWYTMEGQAKRDYPASILHQSTWWKEYKYVEDYFSRIGLLMSQGSPVCDTLVINAVESVWSQVYPGWCKALTAIDKDILKLEDNYAKLFHYLQGGHIDFDYGDEGILKEKASVVLNKENVPVIQVGKASYRQVVVSGMTTMRSSTLSLIEEFVSLGGKVIFAGEAPEYIDAIKDDRALKLSKKAISICFDKDKLIDACNKNVFKMASITDEEGNNINDIFLQARATKEGYIIMMLNVNREKKYSNVRVKINALGFVQLWDCKSGEKYNIDTENGEVILDFPEGGENILVIVNKNEELAVLKREKTKKVVAIEGSFKYKLDEPNICVLDYAALSIDNGEWMAPNEILKVDRKVRSHFGLEFRSGQMIQPWFSAKKNNEAKGRIRLRFEFYIEKMPQDSIELVMEKPENFNVKLNGKLVDTSVQNGWWIDLCFKKIAIDKNSLAFGINIIELEADFKEKMNLEAIYIIGNFGVRIEGNKKFIGTLPGFLSIGNTINSGLPFYTGKIKYIMVADYLRQANQKLYFRLPSYGGACAKVSSKGSREKLIAFKPNEVEVTEFLEKNNELEVEVVLTRRNTFGPLHQRELYARGYGPGNFVTEGKDFTDNYMLVDSGILKAPELIIK